MGTFIVRRVLWMLLVIVVVSGITFFLMHQVPGGPFSRERRLPDHIIRNLERKYHLDRPILEQYLSYMFDILIPRVTAGETGRSTMSDYLFNIQLRGDDKATDENEEIFLRWMNFGPSYASRTRTVNDIFREQLPVSFQLGVMALLFAIALGVPLGILAGLNRNTPIDYVSMAVAIAGVSVPTIVLGPILIWLFGVQLRVLPPTGWGTVEQAVLPVIALGAASSALLARLTRASLLQVMHEDYITTARAKGLAERMVIGLHAFKNALIPVTTVLGPMFAALVTGTFVTETIFGIPGMGRYFITSVTNRDYPVIMGTILLYAVFLVFSNMLVDITYAWLDPRIRFS
ncbi:MAG: ABC transporter permease [Anaerolineae bacterium]|nr:ABC transporter permease [Anaerolineae bacterium]